MKKCPTCEKTFDDAMKFCQTDGTPLIEVTENAPNDPYKTIIAGKSDLTSSAPSDPLKTMEEMPQQKVEDEQIDTLEDADFMKTKVSSPRNFDDSSPLELNSEPLREKPSSSRSPVEDFSSPPISSPLDQPMSPPYESQPVPEFKVEEIKAEALNTPYAEKVEQNQSFRQSEWTPPPAPVASWQSQGIGQNTPFQPPPAIQGENKTLAFVSLVCGILSLFCCTFLIPGVAAVITGYIAKKNAAQKPNEYGGNGMALAGIITGGISILFGLIIYVLYIFTGVLSGIGNIQ